MDHPVSEHSLKRFAEGTSSRAENRSVVTHLLRGCPSCAGQMQSYLRPEIPADAYDGIFERLTGPRLERIQQQGAKLLPFNKPQAPAPQLERRARARS